MMCLCHCGVLVSKGDARQDQVEQWFRTSIDSVASTPTDRTEP